jgi:hypothetical protein
MAAVDLTVQDQLALVAASASPNFVAASANGHTVDNPEGHETQLWFINSGAAITVTFVSARKSNFGTFPNKAITIPGGSTVAIPTFSARRFSDPATGKLSFTLSSVAGVTLAALRLGQYFQEA